MPAGSLLQRLFGRTPHDPLLSAVGAGGRAFARVVFTRNRRVMASVGDDGTTLRLHEHFRDAPEEVLRAIGRALSDGSPAQRAAARETIRAYLRSVPPPPPPRRRAPRRVLATDRPHLERLQAEFDRVNQLFFGGSLPRVPLALSGRMRRRNGHFSPLPLEIVLSRALCEQAVEGEAELTLRHEMIHLWQHQQGHKPGHGRDFRRWAQRLDVHPRATRTVRWKCG